MAQYQLPRDFFFGAAMSGPQTEGQWNQGGKLENLWGYLVHPGSGFVL